MFTKEKTNTCKGIAILLLIFHHLFRSEEAIIPHDMCFFVLPHNIVPGIASCARVCVYMFVFLSAYGLMYKYSHLPEEKKRTFIVDQWFFLMKPFWFIFIIEIAAYALSRGGLISKYEGNFGFFILDFLGLSDLFQTPMLLGVFWYMSLAQILVIMIPAMETILHKIGFGKGILLLTFLLLQVLGKGIYSNNGGDYLSYLFSFVCGCLFAHDDFMNRISQKSYSKIMRVCICCLLLLSAVLFLTLQYRMKVMESDSWRIRSLLNAGAAIAVCLTFGVFIDLKPINTFLAYLGQYCGTMFLIHTFIYSIYPGIVYISKIAILNYVILVIECLLLSILIKYIKKWIHYDTLMDSLFNRITNRITPISSAS